LQLASPDITEALLVSAYDLHHGLLPDHERLLGPEHAQTLYGTTEPARGSGVRLVGALVGC
jgi:hypothetical protein